jgi:hypothetical protein
MNPAARGNVGAEDHSVVTLIGEDDETLTLAPGMLPPTPAEPRHDW